MASKQMRRGGSKQSRCSEYSVHCVKHDLDMARAARESARGSQICNSNSNSSVVSSLGSIFRRNSLSSRYEVNSRVEVKVKEQWIPGTITGLPSQDRSGWGRYCVQCEDRDFGRLMASEKELRGIDSVPIYSSDDSITEVAFIGFSFSSEGADCGETYV
mmetsp:Transcript_23239/g.37177  ORF Transcript_23239/g.37177 Transcript_23239/m.37177 type:complete len:159 (+) Transcript_23239:71-547(+)|eukprot:CAMPEP_0169071160 /NCGR_PEP_ID=MMETSP1015-20121227/5512_1 /TAXON_ID=342587 /ORGANISM="Karlodinium micrum, Strain CCMP2283" /LENGTH=158 /DNA_ID=CAMNT_0009130229 /DNA_START=66 /DNA_END=542 /DNA_ORIENTATION=+